MDEHSMLYPLGHFGNPNTRPTPPTIEQELIDACQQMLYGLRTGDKQELANGMESAQQAIAKATTGVLPSSHST